MSGLMVFLPGYGGQDPEELKRRGLEDLSDRSVSAIFTATNNGPDGRGGKLVTFFSQHIPDTPRSVDAKTQEWKPAPPDPEREFPAAHYWLGFVKDARPTPVELQRPELIDGENVCLLDAQHWTIPIADYCPKRLTFDPATGAEISVPSDRHRLFVQRANEIFEHFLSDIFHEQLKKELTATVPGGLVFAGLALSKNYRVNPFAVDVLELVGEVEAFEIARVAVGMKLIERAIAQKKTPEFSSP